MNRFLSILIPAMILSAATAADDDGFRSIFNGRNLDGWACPLDTVWRVEDGAIVGENTAENPIPGNQFLVWQQGEVDDFELKLRFRIEGSDGANSGIQFRGSIDDTGHVIGYQADIDRAGKWLGALYDEHTGRRLLAGRGQTTKIAADGARDREQHAQPAELLAAIDLDDWNEYHIVARGHEIELRVNGRTTAKVLDRQTDSFDPIGCLALQVHSGPPMVVRFKDIRLKRHPLGGDRKKIVFIADTGNHGFGKHEHDAVGRLLARRLNATGRALMTVHNDPERFPQDPTAFDNADAVVLYSNGGGRHPFNRKLDEIGALMDRGVGLMCMHFAVEVPAEPAGLRFKQWIGGYYEHAWSSNPIWDAALKVHAEHPVGRGVKEITLNDEWYFNMRFRDGMEGVTPILEAKPDDEARATNGYPRQRYDHIWKARGRSEALMWAVERKDGGRGIGWTGGHWHTNFAYDAQRRVLLNAFLWVAGGEVPEGGVDSAPLTVEELNQGLSGKPGQALELPEDAEQ